MPSHRETRRVGWTPEQMFDLVADVRRYPEFLPWVAAVRVRSEDATEMTADLAVGFRALRETFTSRVNKRRPDSIIVEYVEGPLRQLRNDWRFSPDGAGGTRIDFAVDFTFRSRMFEAVAGQVFDRAFRKMVGAFEARATQLYGPPASGRSSSSAQSAA